MNKIIVLILVIMSLTNLTAATLARQLLTERNEANGITLPKIQSLIPNALETWTRECLKDRTKRELFKQTFSPTVASGTLNLTDYLNGVTARINLHDLRQVPVYVTVLRITGATVLGVGSDINGVYTQRGTLGGKPYYNKRGAASDDSLSSIFWSSGDSAWYILNDTGVQLYSSTDDKLTPDLVGTWIAEYGQANLPVFTVGRKPHTWVNSSEQLENTRPVGGDAPACFIEGSNLRVRTMEGSLTGSPTVTFTVTNYPTAVTDISKNLEQDFVTYLALISSRELLAGESIAARSGQ